MDELTDSQLLRFALAASETEAVEPLLQERLGFGPVPDNSNQDGSIPAALGVAAADNAPHAVAQMTDETQEMPDEELLRLALESEEQDRAFNGGGGGTAAGAVQSTSTSEPAVAGAVLPSDQPLRALSAISKRKHDPAAESAGSEEEQSAKRLATADGALLGSSAETQQAPPWGAVAGGNGHQPESDFPDYMDDLDDLIEEQWTNTARPAATIAAVPIRGPAPHDPGPPTEDELLDLLFEESVQRRPAAAAGPSRPAAASSPVGRTAAGLDTPHWMRPSMSAAAAPRFGGGMGASTADVDLGDELDDVLAGGGATAAAAAARSSPAKTAAAELPKPRMAAAAPAPPEPPGWQYTPPCRFASSIRGGCIPVTGHDGERVYCRLEAAVPLYSKGQGREAARLQRRGQLLSEPIGKLMDAVQEAQLNAAVARSWKTDADGQTELQQHVAAGRVEQVAQETELWVDKYSPKGFTGLLSDDKMNREVVHWLKSWEACSFPSKHAEGDRRGAARRSALAAPAAAPVRDRIVLLCGAPGLGKTTLAHVAARHCGYRPYEINASDDRTAAVLTRRIEDAVQMSSVLDRSRRPNCLIIDEIDGATGGAEGHSAIAALLKIVMGSSKEGTQKEAAGGIAKKGKKKAAGPLNRPVIAICNDLYAPALRPLREVARVIHMKTPSQEKMVVRLRDICEREGVKVDRQALLVLIDKTEGDIRACVNTLQFLAKRNTRIRSVDVEGLDVGQKDLTKSAFSVWSDVVFAGQPSKVLRRLAPAEGRLGRQYNMLMDFGEHDLVFAGLHEAMTVLRYLDPSMAKTSGLLDRLADADRLACSSRRRMDFHLLCYLPACALVFRHFIATTDRVALTWPKAQSACARKAIANQEMLHLWHRHLPRETARITQPLRAALDVVPCLKLVTSEVRLRPLAPNMLSVPEQATFQRHVELLLNYGVTYSLEAPSDHPPVAAEAPVRIAPLKPPLDLLHCYPGISSGPSRPVVQEVCRLLAHAATMESIRRLEQARMAQATSSTQAARATGTQATRTPAAAAAAHGGSGARTLQPAAASTAGLHNKAGGQKPAKGNWLDAIKNRGPARKTAPKPASAAGGAAAAAHALPDAGSSGSNRKFSVLYHFNEGYTNAVKRPLLLKDLL